MIQNILHDIEGIHIYGIVSICLFFSFFAGMLLWAVRLKKPYLNSMRDLPLDGGEMKDTFQRVPDNLNAQNRGQGEACLVRSNSHHE